MHDTETKKWPPPGSQQATRDGGHSPPTDEPPTRRKRRGRRKTGRWEGRKSCVKSGYESWTQPGEGQLSPSTTFSFSSSPSSFPLSFVLAIRCTSFFPPSFFFFTSSIHLHNDGQHHQWSPYAGTITVFNLQLSTSQVWLVAHFVLFTCRSFLGAPLLLSSNKCLGSYYSPPIPLYTYLSVSPIPAWLPSIDISWMKSIIMQRFQITGCEKTLTKITRISVRVTLSWGAITAATA